MEDRALNGEVMVKERIIKEDGRYLILYNFRPKEPAGAGPAGSEPSTDAASGRSGHV